MQKLAQGAEAIIYKKESSIIKDRFSKSYRHPEIDQKLRKYRTRHEAKLLEKLRELNIPAPEIRNVDEKKCTIEMEHISGKQVKKIFEKNMKELAKEIGEKIALLHKNNIIHGDLTTSNMLYSKELYFIDFGLSFFSTKPEDKAVDLHLLDRALESKHHKVYPACMDIILQEYKKYYTDADKVLQRYKEVEKRGRNKASY